MAETSRAAAAWSPSASSAAGNRNAALMGWVEFAALRDAAGISDSVLSKQSRVLEDAGYVEVRKGAVGRRPCTWFQLTAEGRQAVRGHLAWLAELEEAVSASTRDVQQARPLPGDRDQPCQVLPPLLGST
jgi:DNA-binding MarR family transcriptional regulator